ncbi:MAG: CvpA family protein [Clostridia bacterium]|nr:CvpA family protein [Clostridia bacterium]
MPGKWYLKIIINILVTAIVAGVVFYFSLPALNFHSMDLYFYIAIVCVAYGLISWVTSSSKGQGVSKGFFERQLGVVIGIISVIFVVVIVGGLASSVLFRADSYSKLLPVESGKFETDIEEVDFSSVPMLDSESTEKLGDRKLGELEDMISQFAVDDYYTQINYQNKPVRVTPLKYSDFIKWFINKKEGIPAYIIIDMVTQEADVVRLKEGMKYSTCEYFNRYLIRHVRFNYPTYMFDEPVFEIDEMGNPYWICPRIDKKIGLFGGTDVVGAVLVNAVTGENNYYSVDEVKTKKDLQWIDRVFSSDLLVEQYNYLGQYQNGFWNSIIGQRGVKVTTEGYNYLALDDDVYLYTGVTSVTDDQSIVGFVLINQRTKEANYYSIAGAKEYSAMDSAEGVVQQFGYTGTFPLLLNISGQPTYFMALKDSSSLVKQYAMVNVEQYQVVATGSSLAECSQNYADLLREKGIIIDVPKIEELEQQEQEKQETLSVTGAITEIRTAVMDGNSVYYIRLADSADYYSLKASDSEIAVILNVGDTVTIEYKASDKAIRSAKSVELA